MKPIGNPDPVPGEFLAVADLLPEALLLVSTRGAIRAANRSCVDDLGGPLAGRELPELVAPEQADALLDYLRRCSTSRQLQPGAMTVITPQRTTFRLDGALYRPRSASEDALVLLRCRRREQSVSRFMLLNRRIEDRGREIARRMRVESERETLLRLEQAARAEAEAANRLKDEFLATLSHELRTPLNAILGWTRMLRMGGLDEARRARALETIERNAYAQAQLVEDLLDVSRLRSGGLRLQLAPIRLANAIELAIESVRPAADNKEIELTSESAADPTVMGDAARLQQIFWNLLANAVKFTPHGGRVTARVGLDGDEAAVTVTDTGQGFSPDVEPRLFQRFYQADQSITRTHGGLGLGLTIVRHLVEAHGGTVEARSAGTGRGATFTVRLPVAVGASAAPVREAGPSSTQADEKV